MLGMVALTMMLGFCVMLALAGYADTAGIVAVGVIVGVVSVFVTGRQADAKELELQRDETD